VFDYRQALDIAIEAAHAAGSLLREEFHREGGPRGEPGKAPADADAEALIRERLLSNFPHWHYRGEETGDSPGDPAETHRWLVDPNDGTTSFQRGRRGPAVSIGLVREGIPVLGVVFAYAAPDDSGDLFAWAEGCGPLMRNGKAVHREAWPESLGAEDIVLLSQGADRRAARNAAAVAPARFHAVPSIAYRLALVAAGEGAAAVSLNSPGDWDYAAGHALLRGSGSVILDQTGAPVRYPMKDRGQVKFCFGGGPRVAAELAQRNWSGVLNSPLDAKATFDFARLAPGRCIADAGVLARAHGCLLGQLAGDALGSEVEFQSSDAIARAHPHGFTKLSGGGHWRTIAGQPTDDSELALILARSIVQGGGFEAERAAQFYRFWYRSAPFDCGEATRAALSAISPDDVFHGRAASVARAAANKTSQANGSLMRVSPLGIFGHARPPAAAAEAACADSAITHPHPVCQDACAVYVVAIAHAISSGAEPRSVYEFTRKWAKANRADELVQRGLEDAETRAPADFQSKMGHVVVALQNAFHQLLSAPTFSEGVVRTVMNGGDTDTNAAIAGGLLGAVHGREAVPVQWRRAVLSCRPLEHMDGVVHPRPSPFWPVDAMELAELLLLAGK